jgi:hypothetical protein
MAKPHAVYQQWMLKYKKDIYINESLTAYRRRLCGKIYAFKNANNYKSISTTNGTIHLRKHHQAVYAILNS